MAVVQISKIQVRRGQKNQGTGIPQLASGEFGWAVDAQELYIGNGAVSEGAPAVGNTQILTNSTDLFSLAENYTWEKDKSYIVTNTNRTLQNKLDDFVTAADFGMTGDASQDATVLLQNALDQLYSNIDKTSENSKVVLYFAPGIYTVNATIYVPSNVNLVGADKSSCIIRNTTSNAIAFQTVNKDSGIGSYADHSTTTSENQNQNISIKNISLETTQENILLQIDSCKNAVFENLNFLGAWDYTTTGIDSSNCAVILNNLTSLIASEDISFKNCKFKSFSYGIYSDWDILNNIWNKCEFEDLGVGIGLGVGNTTLNALENSGKKIGATGNMISECSFLDISEQAVYAKFGQKNTSMNNSFTRTGNNQGVEYEAQHPILQFDQTKNQSIDDIFSRTAILSADSTYFVNPYISEIKGPVNCSYKGTFIPATVTQSTTAQTKFRLSTDLSASNISTHYQVDYTLNSSVYNSTRSGKLFITHNAISNAVTLSDDYEHNGDADKEDAIMFSAALADVDGNSEIETINVLIKSTMPSDDQTDLSYQIKLLK